jgi:hypothetical protein
VTKYVFVLEMESDKPIPDLLDKVAQRAYVIDGRKGDVVCTTLAEYLTDLRKRVDVQPLEVRYA